MIESVKYFTEATLKKCKESLEIRIKFHSGQENIELPDDVNNVNIGYHPRSCYSNFNAINARYRATETSDL